MAAAPTVEEPTGIAGARRVLVAGVGYRNLRDLSVGPVVAERLAAMSWPPGIDVEDLSYGPVAVVHRLREAQPQYDRLVVVAAVQRAYAPGTITCYRWDGCLPGPVEVQARIEEALTGVIDLDNLLIVTGHFEALPGEVVVVEVEPEETEWGESFSSRIAQKLDEVLAIVRAEALAAAAGESSTGTSMRGSRMANGH